MIFYFKIIILYIADNITFYFEWTKFRDQRRNLARIIMKCQLFEVAKSEIVKILKSGE